jgi:hypothetical protein
LMIISKQHFDRGEVRMGSRQHAFGCTTQRLVQHFTSEGHTVLHRNYWGVRQRETRSRSPQFTGTQ